LGRAQEKLSYNSLHLVNVRSLIPEFSYSITITARGLQTADGLLSHVGEVSQINSHSTYHCIVVSGSGSLLLNLRSYGWDRLKAATQHQPNLSANPPPTSSLSRPAKIPLKSIPSPLSFGASPLFGALGLAILLLFSWPALDGNVGNIAVDFGRGSSLNHGCDKTSEAEGRRAGFRARREFRRSAPEVVNNGNFERTTEPIFWGPGGKRRDFAFGRRRKPGQVSSEGMPQSSKIWMFLVFAS
jgi:hypothetical protein